MTENRADDTEIVRFLRRRDYKLVKELGQGSSGKTVLLYDEQIDQYFVCKKYLPHSDAHKAMLFESFVNEIKLLHKLQHPNIVRLFNYYLYPDAFAGYILMEHVDGHDLEAYAALRPEQISDLFSQAITGFSYLERSKILHRDVRPGNILVNSSGLLKIIDLGFGKYVTDAGAFEKSIDLSWWCPTPKEFGIDRYDFSTEVYFLGKLFESIVSKLEPDEFHYTGEIEKMCARDPDKRTQTFTEIERRILSSQFLEADFSPEEISAYRNFSEALYKKVTKLDNDAKYIDDVGQVRSQLKVVFRTFMLEEFVPDSSVVFRCFIAGGYRYYKNNLRVSVVGDFLKMLSGSGEGKSRIILANLHRKFDSVERYSQYKITDDVPF